MMAKHGKLFILVQSSRYIDFVENLVDAAIGKGKEIRIHLIGAGVTFIESPRFTRHARRVRITICSTSFDKKFMKQNPTLPKMVKSIQPEKVSDIVEWSDRCVVF